MNILTFDIEEWFVEKVFDGNRPFKYRQFDEAFNMLMDILDQLNMKATFFCVGQLAREFPEVIKRIVEKGHEIGCHSDIHTWLNKMDETTLFQDTKNALSNLEDVSGQRVTSYRAPAFSITPQNKWAINVLADCGIESDASIFPTIRDFGGYPSFPYEVPCIISYQGSTLKEYPIGLVTLFGKKIAYSGGGYFRLIPYWLVNRIMKRREYNICYFHLADLIHEKHKIMSKSDFENYFKEPGSLKNRVIRYAKSNVGTANAYGKLKKLLSNYEFINVGKADTLIDWDNVNLVSL